MDIQAEARAFVLDQQVRTCSIYEGEGSAPEAKAFLSVFARSTTPIPRTCVLDAALIRGRGWALLKANASWGAGLNGCDPTRAIACIAEATRPS